nr:hypothetical protein Iba_chr12eCG14510 [Ipomoea batatas]
MPRGVLLRASLGRPHAAAQAAGAYQHRRRKSLLAREKIPEVHFTLLILIYRPHKRKKKVATSLNSQASNSKVLSSPSQLWWTVITEQRSVR